jgi:hypothetical protein
MIPGLCPGIFFRHKTKKARRKRQAFFFVAGAGLEPTTFGL